MKPTETLIHFAWKHKLISNFPLATTQGESIEIINWGHHNHIDGPDFINAKITIGGITLAGNIELHLNTSDWLKHKHSNDSKYNNVILHVVLNHDDNSLILPTLELKNHLSEHLFNRYNLLMQSTEPIACSSMLNRLNDIHIKIWLQRLMVERLETKTNQILYEVDLQTGHMEEVFYQKWMRYLGKTTNGVVFEQLARLLPMKIIAKHKANKTEIEALLIGVAGLLDIIDSSQHNSIFTYLQVKYQLKTLSTTHWNFGKIRPQAAPLTMLMIMADLMQQSSNLLTQFISSESITEIKKKIHNACFKTPTESLHWGDETISTLLINVVIPFVYVQGKRTDNEALCNKATTWLDTIKPEKNNIITLWKSRAIIPTNAADTQALLQLYNQYCIEKNCLQCAWGLQLLGK